MALAGCVEDEHGGFGWAVPPSEVENASSKTVYRQTLS